MGLDVCSALWGGFQNSPQPTRALQPQSQASPKAVFGGGGGKELLPLSMGRNRINVYMKFRFHMCGASARQDTFLWPLSYWPGLTKQFIPLLKRALAILFWGPL